MAHWAEIDKNNIVTQVLVGNNAEPDEGYQWLIDNLGGTWVQTSYNTRHGVHELGKTPLRKNFAAIGYTYDKELDAFIPPKPFASWVLDEKTCTWKSPIPIPTDGKVYLWDDNSTSWQEAPSAE
jgi:hypothetical protein